MVSGLIVGSVTWGPVYVGPRTHAVMPGVTSRATLHFTDPVTPTDANDPVPPDEDEPVEQGAKMDPHGDEPESDPLPEGIDDDDGDEE
jgi:hypothetical protein